MNTLKGEIVCILQEKTKTHHTHVYRFVAKRIRGSYFAADLVISSVNMSRTLQ